MIETERRQRLGTALARLQAGRWDAAAAHCHGLLLRDPADTQARLLGAFARAGRGEIGDAAATMAEIACAHPEQAHPCADFAALCPTGPAAALYRACLAQTPGDKRLRRLCAAFLLDRGEAAEAEQVLRGALGSAAGHHTMGLALAEQGKFRDAIGHFREAAALDPVPSMAWANLGMVLKIEGRHEEALAAYDEAVARSPNDAAIRVNRMVALLHAGRWAEAWRDGDWRLRLPGYTGLPADRLLPNPDAAAGRTILLTHEEGFGDTLQFLRYAPLLAERGARVLLRMPPPLIRIAARVPGIAAVLPEDAVLPEYDYHCPMVSLPCVFGTMPDTIPPGDYLRDVYERNVEPCVGLVWAGQARPWLPGFTALDARRSADAAVFAPLAAVSGVQFVSLQMGEAAAHPPPGLALSNPMAGVRDFADTAAIVAGLDLVISVDTSVVHLAGAMGKPAFLLDRYDNCWRWLSGRADSPWYPALTIFRQDEPGDWGPPVKRVVAALNRFVVTRARPSPALRYLDAA
jgi:Flp pilus assembly protein TadD